MRHRPITAILGVLAGGLFGAALPPTVIARADEYQIVPDPNAPADIVGIYGLEATPPAVPISVQADQLFDIKDTTTDVVTGTFDGQSSTASDLFGGTDYGLLVTADESGTVGTAAGDVPPVGSVFDLFTVGTLGDGGYVNIYSALPSASGDVISDTLVTPFGDVTIPITFDAAKGIADGSSDDHPVDLSGGYFIAPDPDSSETFTAITGFPPFDVAIQEDQLFGIDSTAIGATGGTFDADVTTGSDTFGLYPEELLVTADESGTVGTTAGDVPPVGSVFNVFFFGDDGFYNVYSALPSASGDVISDTLVTHRGSYDIPLTFDASAGPLSNSATVPLSDGDHIVADPHSIEQFTGVNGLPPLHVSVQGDQLFDVDNANGDVVGSFDADKTTASFIFGQSTQTLLVTDDVTGSAGTAVGDVPPAGSVFDTADFGFGFENIYSDLVSSSGNVITDTFVTPFGDVTIPTVVDLAAAFGLDSLTIP